MRVLVRVKWDPRKGNSDDTESKKESYVNRLLCALVDGNSCMQLTTTKCNTLLWTIRIEVHTEKKDADYFSPTTPKHKKKTLPHNTFFLRSKHSAIHSPLTTHHVEETYSLNHTAFSK